MNYLAFRSAAIAAGLGLVACGGAASEELSDVEPSVQEGAAALSIYIGGGDGDGDAVVTVDPARELLITELSVVEDPVRTTWPAGQRSGSQAVWTFGRIMELLAGSDAAAPQFTLEWLKKWELDQTINGYNASARPLIKDVLIDPWLAASGGVKLNMRKAPFRLLAIVNRLDLRTPSGSSSGAGEGRFVFGALKPDGSPLPFTVIFEYGIPAWCSDDVQDWAERWHQLGAIPFGASYNSKLEKITKDFTKVGCAQWKPNGSCINQVRTNEVPLNPQKGWELREFRLSQVGKLVEVVTVQTPDGSLNGTDTLANFINANESAAKAGKHVVPASFLAPSAMESLSSFWSAPGIVDNDARHGFAITTCNGCHTGETGTVFLHVKNRVAGVPSGLSGFLTGTTVADPASGVPRTFNDLARRAVDMQGVLDD